MPWHSPYCCDWLKGICARLCACVNSTEKDGGRGQELGLFLALSPFHHAERVVKDRMRAKEQQIDYPVCRKCVQGLCRETETKQRPHSGDDLRHTRANVIIKQWRDGPLILCWYSKMLNNSSTPKLRLNLGPDVFFTSVSILLCNSCVMCPLSQGGATHDV